MARLALAVLLVAGCSAQEAVPMVGSAPAVGMKRWSAEKRQPPAVHAGSRRGSLPAASRSQLRASIAQVTMYCYTGSRNAAGKWPTVGTAAANAYPLGTRLHVEGVGVVTVEDRSAPNATDVDVYGGSDSGCAARAAAFGRRLLHVSEVAA